MALKVERFDMWVAGMKDKPGALTDKLQSLSKAGVNLKFVLARRALEKPGRAVAFVTPVKGAKQCRAAKAAGFRKSKSLVAVRVQGQDKRGRGAKMTAALADAGLNLRGLSAATFGKNFVAHVALDSTADANKAMKVLKAL